MTSLVAARSVAAIRIDYGPDVEGEIDRLAGLVQAHGELAIGASPRWPAVKLLEGDPEIQARVAGLPGSELVLAAAREAATRLEALTGDDVDTLIADGRYTWIHEVVRDTVQRPPIERVTLSDRIDAVVTHRYLGVPIFLLAMWAAFKITTEVSSPLLDWIAALFEGPVTRQSMQLLRVAGWSGTWIEGLVVDGVLAGVGGVLVFVPVLMSLYFVLALLEDSGYMARAAFVMDRLMQSFGLHGKSFLPMLVGFGCTVPAIYATRTLRGERDRILTGLLVPFMSCGARLPVYVLFAAVFFPERAGTIVFSMYLVGIAAALALGVVLHRSLFRAAQGAPFVMELPPYRMPTARSVLTQMWQRTGSFVRKAWTLILFTSIVLWVLMALPAPSAPAGAGDVDDSLFAALSGAAAPIFAPLGFDSWQATGALITGLIAKEVVVSTMAQVYGAEVAHGASDHAPDLAAADLRRDLETTAAGLGRALMDTMRALPRVVGLGAPAAEDEAPPSDLMAAIHGDFDRSSGGYASLAGLAFMVFVLLYTPCMVAIAATRHEFGARWMWTSVLGQFAIAWLVAFVVFQVGRVLVS